MSTPPRLATLLQTPSRFQVALFPPPAQAAHLLSTPEAKEDPETVPDLAWSASPESGLDEEQCALAKRTHALGLRWVSSGRVGPILVQDEGVADTWLHLIKALHAWLRLPASVNGANTMCRLLLGHRGCGKSTLLRTLALSASATAQDCCVLHVTIPKPSEEDPCSMEFLLPEAIVTGLRQRFPHDMKCDGIGLLARRRSGHAWLSAILDFCEASGMKVLLVLDEMHRVYRHGSGARLHFQLHDIANRGSGACLCFATGRCPLLRSLVYGYLRRVPMTCGPLCCRHPGYEGGPGWSLNDRKFRAVTLPPITSHAAFRAALRLVHARGPCPWGDNDLLATHGLWRSIADPTGAPVHKPPSSRLLQLWEAMVKAMKEAGVSLPVSTCDTAAGAASGRSGSTPLPLVSVQCKEVLAACQAAVPPIGEVHLYEFMRNGHLEYDDSSTNP